MKDLFAFDKKNGFVNLKQYTSMELAPLAKEKKKTIKDNSSDVINLPKNWASLMSGGYLFILFGLIAFAWFLLIKDNKKATEAEKYLTVFVSISLVLLGIFMLIYWYASIRKKAAKLIEDYTDVGNEKKTLTNEDFDNGDSAIRLDIFCPSCKTIKNGELKQASKYNQIYQNKGFIVFFHHHDLCLLFNEVVYLLPDVENIKLEVFQKRIRFMGWNKPDPVLPKYGKVVRDEDRHATGIINCKGYAKVSMTVGFEPASFIIPIYDVKAFKRLVYFSR